MIIVINVKGKKYSDLKKDPRFIYCGRKYMDFPKSIFHNPFKVGYPNSRICPDRDNVIQQFKIYLIDKLQNKQFSDQFYDIPPDAILGCWCKPLACHCDIIAGILNTIDIPPILSTVDGRIGFVTEDFGDLGN